MRAIEIKNYIASCECIVASRYHSCVAALSSGVPVMIIGWHYKYEELLNLYQQEKWLISEKDCTPEKLVGMFNDFYANIYLSRSVIESNGKIIKKKVIDVARKTYRK